MDDWTRALVQLVVCRGLDIHRTVKLICDGGGEGKDGSGFHPESHHQNYSDRVDLEPPGHRDAFRQFCATLSEVVCDEFPSLQNSLFDTCVEPKVSLEVDGDSSMAQFTWVSQLVDVRLTVWMDYHGAMKGGKWTIGEMYTHLSKQQSVREAMSTCITMFSNTK